MWCGVLSKSKDKLRPRVSLVNAYVDPDGKRVVTGNAELKRSQAYPPAFGTAVYRLWAMHRVELLGEAAERMEAFKIFLVDGVEPVDLFCPLPGEDRWEDAGLEPIFHYLHTGRVP